MAQKYIIILDAVAMEPSNAFIFLDGRIEGSNKMVRLPLSPQIFEIPTGSDILKEMTILADGFRTKIGKKINIIQED